MKCNHKGMYFDFNFCGRIEIKCNHTGIYFYYFLFFNNIIRYLFQILACYKILYESKLLIFIPLDNKYKVFMVSPKVAC